MWLLLSAFLGLGSAQEHVQDVYTTLSERYDDGMLQKSAIEGMLQVVDQQSGLMGSQVLTYPEFEEWKGWKRGEREGYGIRIQVLAGRGLVIDHVMMDSPAHKAGLQAGDFIVSINTRSLSGLSADQMLSVLEAEGADRLIVDILREGTQRTMRLQKGEFVVPQVNRISESQFPSKPVLRVHFFGENSSTEIKKHLEQGTVPIIDLRDNQGGLWEEAVATLDMFFPKDTVLAYRQYADGTKIPVLSQSSAVQTEPVVILINQGTRGPAELVALTLQENGMATLVGERSAGEAIDYHVLYPNRELVLLMADVRLLSSKKRQWHDAGVVPNLSISPSQNYRGEDRQQQAAIQLISSKP
jgi:carboxyl-terminal processing protease